MVAGCDGRKCTRIEVHLLVPEGLQPVMDAPIYGRIACMELFRPPVRLSTAPSPAGPPGHLPKLTPTP